MRTSPAAFHQDMMSATGPDFRPGRRILEGLLFLVYLMGFYLFYVVYVPLVAPYQVILAPLLVLVFLLTLGSLGAGLLAFVFVFPLINGLPNFFGFYDNIPHAPAALVLSLALFGGWLGRRVLVPSGRRLDRDTPSPLVPLAVLVIASGVITVVRYADFAPFRPGGFRELIVNANGVRAGGAVMSTVFSLLFYLSGFFLFVLLVRMFRSRPFLVKVAHVLAGALGVSLLFALAQKIHPEGLGNSPLWIGLSQINSTFKDPNSFAVFLGAFLPLMLGLALAGKMPARAFFIGLVILGLAVFPFTGSRSALLGLGGSLAFFLFMHLGKSRPLIRGKALSFSLAAAGAAVLSLMLPFLFRNAVLTERSLQALRLVQSQDSLAGALSGKAELWKVAGAMVRDYPLTGVGLGSFIIELPNYGQRLRLPLFKDYTDSAENHYLHVAAETGLLGLALYLWLFIAIVKRMSSRWMGFSGRDPSRFVFLGAASGLAGFFVNFLFHSYMASYEVYFGFWILAAMIYAFPQPSGFPRSEERKRSPRPVIVAAALAVLAFGAVHLWNSAHSLSISSRTREFGWPQDFGLYAEEKDEAGFSFRWTRRTAGLAVAGLGQEVVLPVLASHPDLERKPVTLKVFAATRDFRKLSLIREVVLRTRSWGEVSWRRTRGEGSESYILLETDRAWLPKRAIGADDSRSLAVAVGVAWFRYPRDVPPESVESVRILPRTGWEGGQGNRLTRSGRAKISFRSGPRCLVRLRLRGSAAFGIGPLIAVSLDGAPVARTFIRTDGWSSLVLPVRVGEGDHVIEVDFLNDIAKDAEDRNVALGDMEVISLRGQAPELRRKWRHDD